MPYKDSAKQKAAQRSHYLNRKQRYADRARAIRFRNQQYVMAYLKTHPCIVCGENDIVVLEFDHRDPSQKEDSINNACGGRFFSLKRLQEEIEKCDVLCANCHRRKTARERGYFRYTHG